jgi:hypothetical protein
LRSVRIEVDDAPELVTDCNCSLCHRKGALWAYYHPTKVRHVAGETVAYVQGDRALETHRCPRCGCTTHWTSIDPKYERMGVNSRLMPPQVLAGMRVKRFDGAGDWEILASAAARLRAAVA